MVAAAGAMVAAGKKGEKPEQVQLQDKQ